MDLVLAVAGDQENNTAQQLSTMLQIRSALGTVGAPLLRSEHLRIRQGLTVPPLGLYFEYFWDVIERGLNDAIMK